MNLGGDTRAQTVALAGLFQSLSLVQELARSGGISAPAAYEICMSSVLRVDADSALEIYDGACGLRLGLQQLLRHLQGPMNPEALEQAGYAARLMYLERQLGADHCALRALGNAVSTLAGEVLPGDVDDLPHVEALARLYVQHVSPLGPKVMVSGNPSHLKRHAVAARIRALLLAGIRAAVLWRQSGGGRLHMLLLRKRYARIAQSLLQESRR